MPPTPATFEFVSITSSAPVLSAEGRGLIKKHVMKDIGRARRKYIWDEADLAPSTRVNEECSTPSARQRASPSTTNSSSSTDDDEPVRSRHDSECISHSIVKAPKPRTVLAGGHVDPFSSFPVDEADVFLLVDHSTSSLPGLSHYLYML